MGKPDLRKKLHAYIADLDIEKVKAILALLEDGVTYNIKSSLTQKDKEEILRREQNRESGKSKTYTLAESKKLIRRKSAGLSAVLVFCVPSADN